MTPQIPRYKTEQREKLVLMWLWKALSEIGVKLGPGRLSASAKQDVAQMVEREGDPAHAEIVEAIRNARASGYQMSGNLINISSKLPAIQAAINEEMRHEYEPV